MTTPNPSAMMAAPNRPPNNACDEDEGIPNTQVNKFHMIAANTPATTTMMVIADGSIKSLPMVSATATPKRKGAINSATAVMYNAVRGFIARDEITVATMLDESWKPFRKSKTKDAATKK